MTKKGVKAHRCPCCGRRTYRRPRHLTGDHRCAPCAKRGYWPRRVTA